MQKTELSTAEELEHNYKKKKMSVDTDQKEPSENNKDMLQLNSQKKNFSAQQQMHKKPDFGQKDIKEDCDKDVTCFFTPIDR